MRKRRTRKQVSIWKLPDNHKRRRHAHRLYIHAGYTPELSSVEPNGRKHWRYVRSMKISLRTDHPERQVAMGLDS